jgi:hypothetical protein
MPHEIPNDAGRAGLIHAKLPHDFSAVNVCPDL